MEGHGSISLADLTWATKRHAPDRIVVGEVRGAEAFDMLQAMNTGHTGSMSTIHANGAADALARLEAMVLMAGTGLPLPAVRTQIASAIHIVVHMERTDGGGRRVGEVLHVHGVEGDELLVAPAFATPPDAGAANGTKLRREWP